MRAAGEGNRLKIMCMLFKKEKMCVSDTAKELGMSVATASHHFQELARVGLVDFERNGKTICYFVSKAPLVKDLKNFICKHK